MMVVCSDKCASDRIKQVRGHAGISDDGIYKVEETVSFIIRIGMHQRIGIIRPRVTVKTSSALTVFKDDHFSVEAIGVIQNPLY